MDVAKLISKLNYSNSLSPAFTVEDFLIFAEPTVPQSDLKQELVSNPNLICHRTHTELDYFILDITLFRWFANLNMHLAQIKQFKLTEQQATLTLNRLRSKGQWDSPPLEFIKWALRLGLISTSSNQGEYLFPLARFLSYLPNKWLGIVSEIFLEFSAKRIWTCSPKELVNETLQEAFFTFPTRVVDIVKAREGLLTKGKSTLEQLGKSLGLSRERIRQLENNFWNKLHKSRYWQLQKSPLKLFFSALLYDFIAEAGKFIVDTSSQKATVRKFLAKCVGLPYTELANYKLLVYGTSVKQFTMLKSKKWCSEQLDVNTMENCLKSNNSLWLIEDDIKILAERVTQARRQLLNKTQKVYLALRHIGRPAHYSKVAEVYNSLFPDHWVNERNVHAILSREMYGVVWVGVRGAYALKEWGYEHPSEPLFDTVTKIVEESYKVSGEPVSFTVILAEIGKHRRIVNRSSLTLAAYCNHNLRQVTKDCFVPKDSNNETQNSFPTPNDLDDVLQQFEK